MIRPRGVDTSTVCGSEVVATNNLFLLFHVYRYTRFKYIRRNVEES
jgi:hypothetical protein